MIRYDHYTDKFVKVSDRECPWCKAVCASTDKYCHECGWHIADAPQTDLLVKTPHKSRESHEKNCETCRDKDAYDEWQGNCDECENGSMYTPQTDLSAEEFVEGMKNLKMEVKRTDCDRYVVDEAGEKHYGCMGCQTDCPWK